MEQIIKDNPGFKLLSLQKLKKVVRDKYDIPVKEIEAYYNNREINQIFKPVKSKKENKLVITAEPFSFQIDIVKLTSYKRQNNNIDQFLLLVDITSRRAFAYVLKSGKMADVMDKYEQFLKDVGEDVKAVSGDDFFNNKEFLAFNEELGIEVNTDVAAEDHITNQGNKLGIIDRLVRTLKMNIEKYMIDNKNTKWTKFLDKIIDNYNDAPHSSLQSGFTPNEVFDDPDYAEKIHIAKSLSNQKEFEKIDLDIGDMVRTQLGKNTFEKEKQKYSTEVYIIVAREGYKYVLENSKGTELKRRYRPNELLKIKGVEVTGINNVVEKEKVTHKRVLRVARGTNKDYCESAKAVENADSAKFKVNKLRNSPKVMQQGSTIRQTDRVTRSGKIS